MRDEHVLDVLTAWAQSEHLNVVRAARKQVKKFKVAAAYDLMLDATTFVDDVVYPKSELLDARFGDVGSLTGDETSATYVPCDYDAWVAAQQSEWEGVYLDPWRDFPAHTFNLPLVSARNSLSDLAAVVVEAHRLGADIDARLAALANPPYLPCGA